MKKSAILGLGVAFSLALAGTSFARHTETKVGWAANGINASRHNLSTSGSHFNMRTNTADFSAGVRGAVISGTSEMCAICHTPHFAERSAGPLWNRAIASSTITGYGTTIAKNVGDGANMFSTLACLSCHDGVTTFSSLINKPGKGTGQALAYGTGPGQGVDGSWTVRDAGDDATIDSQKITSKRLRIGGNGAGNTTGGTDLSDDHPIGVLYRGQGETDASASLRAKTVVISSVSINVETENGTPIDALVSGNLWAVKGFISNTATIQDLLRSGTGQGSGNYIQCSSCHDLHYKNQTNPEAWFVSTYGDTPGAGAVNHEDDAIDGLFLRRVGGNSDSGLCRTCHDKQ